MDCCFYGFLGMPPFDGPSEFLTFLVSTTLEYEFPPHFPLLAQDLVASLLHLEPEKRLSSGCPGEILNVFLLLILACLL